MTLHADVAPVIRTGRPRSSRADEAILEAVLDLLSEGVTVDAISIEAVASRAGVGKATIYRRWSNKQAMLADAVRELKGTPPEPVGSNVRERILSLLNASGKGHDARAARIFPCLMPEVLRSDIAYKIWQEVIVEPRREVFRGVLRRAIDEGELRADLDLEVALSVLSGPILLNRMLRWNPGLDDDTLPEHVVDIVLEGIAAR
ncbi:MAG TPA: TetR/AcrR family transcriptional regulator [Candidatus Limnocylindrales bacterium]